MGIGCPCKSGAPDVAKIPPSKLFPSIAPSSIQQAEFLAEGGHATVFKVKLTLYDGSSITAVMKAFIREHVQELRQEVAAYKIFFSCNVKQIVPQLYAYKVWTRREWNQKFPSLRLESETGESKGKITTLFLEYIANAETISPDNVSTMIAAKALAAMESIHELGIMHGDIHKHNLLIVPTTGRIVWIDFSAAVTPVDRLEKWLAFELKGVVDLVYYDNVSNLECFIH